MGEIPNHVENSITNKADSYKYFKNDKDNMNCVHFRSNPSRLFRMETENQVPPEQQGFADDIVLREQMKKRTRYIV